MGTLGLGSALMIASGYYGELTIVGDLTPRWACWFLSMTFFCYIVFELLVGLAGATNDEADETVSGQDQERPAYDSRKLVHVPSCVPVPHASDWWRQCCCRGSGWLLRVRHHLQVWCRFADLSDHIRQVGQGRLDELSRLQRIVVSRHS